MRMLLEKRVHDFISKDNDKLLKAYVEHSLRRRRRNETADRPSLGSPVPGLSRCSPPPTPGERDDRGSN